MTQFNQEDFRLALHRKAENIQLEASRKLFQLSKFEAEIFLRANLFVANVINSAVPANTQSLFIQFSRASLVTTPIIFRYTLGSQRVTLGSRYLYIRFSFEEYNNYIKYK